MATSAGGRASWGSVVVRRGFDLGSGAAGGGPRGSTSIYCKMRLILFPGVGRPFPGFLTSPSSLSADGGAGSPLSFSVTGGEWGASFIDGSGLKVSGD